MNFHQSLDEECLCFLNAIEPGLVVPIQHHLTKDEAFLLLRGKVCVTTYNDDGTILDSIVLNPSEDNYGVNIDKNVWHTVEALESSVLFEVKEGPFVLHEEEVLLTIILKTPSSNHSCWFSKPSVLIRIMAISKSVA